MRQKNLQTLLWRALRLRCPACGQGQLFRGFFATEKNCPHCHLVTEREPGFFLGAIYFNYGITAILTVVGYGSLRFGIGLSSRQALWATVAVAVVFPIFFHRYARSLWMAFDQLYDPRTPE